MTCDDQFGCVAGFFFGLIEESLVGWGEMAEYVGDHVAVWREFADTDADADEFFGAEMGDYILQAVVSASGTFFPDADVATVESDIIGKDYDLSCRIELIEVREVADRLTA